MGLRLEIVSRHRQSLGERSVMEFGPDGGTIGRSLESDWVLPDGQRYLSSRHASIDCRAGSYYIIDTSTNGVYVNGADQPVGRGNPQRLFTDDRIRMGEYIIRVTIDDDSTGEQLADAPHVDPVDRAMRVEPPETSTGTLLEEHEITGVGLDLLLDESQSRSLGAVPESQYSGEYDLSGLSLEDTGDIHAQTRPDPTAPLADADNSGDHAPPAQQASAAQAAPQPREPTTRPASAKPAPQPTAKPQSRGAGQPPSRPAAKPEAGPRPRHAGPAGPSGNPAFDAFMTGAGLQPHALEPREIEQLMHALGRVMRETITGLSESLHLRATQKAVLRQSNTAIQPRDNNPLKFASGVDESLQALLFGTSAEYMPPVDAVRGAFKDLKLHQQTLLRALYKAFDRYIERLDPDHVEEQCSSGRRGALLGAANKLKYWDYYKDLYLVVAQHASGELPAQLLEELAQAYDEELGKTPDASADEPEASVG